jgi:hypothetical protein
MHLPVTVIPRDALRLVVTQGAELPNRTLTWLNPATGAPIPFASDPHTFELRVAAGDTMFVKTGGIVGVDGDPNVMISFAADELLMLAPAHYPAQLWARQQSTGLDQDPINIRLVVEHGISSEDMVPFPAAAPAEAFNVLAPGMVARTRALLAEAATRRVFVQAWGGSVTQGDPGASDPLTTAWPWILAAALRDRYGNGGSGYWNVGYAARTGSWVIQGWPGFGAGEWRATAAATITWADVVGTTVRIYHRNVGVTGSFRWRIDGGSFTVVTPPTGFGLEPGTVEVTGLADGPHTVEVEWVSGTVGINGVEGRRATGVIMQVCAVGGRGFTDYDRKAVRRAAIGITNASQTITSTAPGHFTSSDVGRFLHTFAGGAGIPTDASITAVASATSATISAPATATGTRTVDFCIGRPSDEGWPSITRGNVFAPGLLDTGTPGADLMICEFGINDGGGGDTTLDRAGRGIDKVLGSAAGPREVVVMGGHHGLFSDQSGPYIMRGLGQAVAAACSGAYVDIWGRGRRSFTFWNDAGHFFDPVHPSDSGHAIMAEALIDLLVGA